MIRELVRGSLIDYREVLSNLRFKVLKQTPLHLSENRVLFHQDSTRVHTVVVATVKLKELDYELTFDPPYSPDLVVSDYLLFPNLKDSGKTKLAPIMKLPLK